MQASEWLQLTANNYLFSVPGLASFYPKCPTVDIGAPYCFVPFIDRGVRGRAFTQGFMVQKSLQFPKCMNPIQGSGGGKGLGVRGVSDFAPSSRAGKFILFLKGS